MSTNRLFVFSIVITLATVAAFAVRGVVSPVNAVMGVDSSFTESKEESLRESQLSERYGELPGYIDGFSAAQIQREYELGERYGKSPQLIAQFSAAQIQQEYILGERYGVTPQKYTAQQSLREYWLGERYGQTP